MIRFFFARIGNENLQVGAEAEKFLNYTRTGHQAANIIFNLKALDIKGLQGPTFFVVLFLFLNLRSRH